MENDRLQEILDNLKLNNCISLQDMPEIDLYMDQVIQLFENSFGSTVRNKDEKVLTKTMINNYAKDKLLMPIKNKKYSKDHIILLSLIYQLKGSLSINDIKKALSPAINSSFDKDSFSLRDFYDSYLAILENNAGEFREEITRKLHDINSNTSNDFTPNEEYAKSILLILSLANMSNLYRKTTEKMIDELLSQKK